MNLDMISAFKNRFLKGAFSEEGIERFENKLKQDMDNEDHVGEDPELNNEEKRFIEEYFDIHIINKPGEKIFDVYLYLFKNIDNREFVRQLMHLVSRHRANDLNFFIRLCEIIVEQVK